MKLLVFGATGQVAHALRHHAPDATFLARGDADLTDPGRCVAAIQATGADAVINAAAYTAVDQAESEEAQATVINGSTPAAMARACASSGLPFLHLSTDYVFNGEGNAPWHPDDDIGPLGAYGRSKLAGEHGIRAAGGTFVILRTSWVFSAHGTNFVKSMLRLGKTRESVGIVADQTGGPTAADDIAAALLDIARVLKSGNGAPGTYHFAGAPNVSWADFAREIFRKAHVPAQVIDIPTEAYPTPARRPRNSRLDCGTTETVFGIPRPDWRESLTKVLKDLGELK